MKNPQSKISMKKIKSSSQITLHHLSLLQLFPSNFHLQAPSQKLSPFLPGPGCEVLHTQTKYLLTFQYQQAPFQP